MVERFVERVLPGEHAGVHVAHVGRHEPSACEIRPLEDSALEQADPVLLEPIMLVTVLVPEASVGDVIGDLNSRRGRPQGMEPAGASTEIKAEVPMSEMLSYAPDLRSITGGQGDYTMELLRYEEIPAHLAQRVVEQAGGEPAAAHA